MLRKRLLILLVGCFLMASAAWADDVGYVDCASHPDAAQVYAKARQTPDIVASVACGERFTILVYGFIFSRVQTKDGKIGYVYSSLVSVDHSGVPVQSAARVPAPSPTPATSPATSPVPTYAPVATPSAAQTSPVPQAAQPAPASQPQPASAQPTPTLPGPEKVLSAISSSAPAASASNTQPSATPAQPSPASTSQPQPTAADTQPLTPAVSQPAPPPPSDTQPASAQPSSTTADAPATSGSSDPVMYAPPPPEPAPSARSVRSTWEQPLPGARRTFLLEFYGGYSYNRFVSGGTTTNFMGGMGSFGYNLTSWLQIVGDSSYNFVTVSGTKYVLYGNHYGPRFYYRGRNPWGLKPFAEVLIGGSRLDTTLAGTKTSSNIISYKAGGGVDVRVARHWEIRLFDIDYYRTTFGTNATQNNYSASAGVILRLFGTGAAQ